MNSPREDIYSFGSLCQRPDGSLYGTAGQCRKGKEISPDQLKATVSEAIKKDEAEFKKTLDQVARRALERDSATIALGMAQELNQGWKEEEFQEFRKLRDQYKKEFEEKLNKGDVSLKDVEEVILKTGLVDGDLQNAKTVIIGMEMSGHPTDLIPARQSDIKALGYKSEKELLEAKPELKRKFIEGVNAKLAEDYAVVKAIEAIGTPKYNNHYEWAMETGQEVRIKPSRFHQSHSRIMAGMMDGQIKSPERLLGDFQLAGMELRGLRANQFGGNKSMNSWAYPEMPWVKNNPQIAEALKSRQEYYRRYDQRRVEEMARRISEASKTNKNLRHIQIGMGSSEESKAASKAVFDALKNPNSKIHTFVHRPNKSMAAIGTIMDLNGDGRVYVTDMGVSASHSISWPSIAHAFKTERLRMEAGTSRLRSRERSEKILARVEKK